MKKILTFLMAVFFAATAMADTYEQDGLTYTLYLGDNPTASVSACKYDVTVAIIPETIHVEDQDFVVNKIDWSAFEDRSNLTDVQIPNTVTSIGLYAFSHCTSLTEIRIPASITSIGSFAFGNCSSLKEIIVDDNNVDFTSKDGVLFSKDMSNLYVYPAGKEDKPYSVPDGVTTLWQSSFYSCSQLTEVKLPNTVTFIGNEAFTKSGLTEIMIPKSVSNIIVKAFWDCNDLKRFIVDDNNPNYSSVDGVLFNKEKSALIVCPMKLESTSYSIPSGVNKIEEAAFAMCTGLSEIIIPNSVTSIGDEAFIRCTGLTGIEFPNSLTSIGGWAFDGCSGIGDIILPNSIVDIGRYAFDGACAVGGQSLYIPGSVSHIGGCAFNTIGDFDAIYYNTTDPLPCAQNTFGYYTYQKATLYVAPGGKEKAAVTEPWKNFLNIEEKEFAGIEETMVDFDSNSPVTVYDLNGISVASSVDNLAPGLYIIRQGNKSQKISIK